jgi:hypothetical protein
MKIKQSYNNRINAWIKYKKHSNGKTEILQVKKREPQKPFKL